MLCQNCGKNDATTHYHSVINGVVKDKYLCSECAVKDRQMSVGENDFLKMLTSFFNDSSVQNLKTVKCECCGTTFADIRLNGKVGCGNCYNVFKEELTPTLQRIHGRTTHIGKRPSDNNETLDILDDLKKQLKKAIETENYEEAANLRDLIRQKEA